MQRISIDDSDDGDGGAIQNDLSEALEATGFALNRYRLPPGTGLPSGLHTHLDQEEVFVVLEGRLTFETLSKAVTVDASEAVRFAPDEYQTGMNDGETVAVALAVGAPKDSEVVRVPLSCPDCGARGLAPEFRDDEVGLACSDCGESHLMRGCPACEREELRVRSGDAEGETVVRCPDCGEELAEPRWRE